MGRKRLPMVPAHARGQMGPRAAVSGDLVARDPSLSATKCVRETRFAGPHILPVDSSEARMPFPGEAM
eukprot:scaffold3974_cov231-Pinguiococcus_pyrenoidosus.AAC.3